MPGSPEYQKLYLHKDGEAHSHQIFTNSLTGSDSEFKGDISPCGYYTRRSSTTRDVHGSSLRILRRSCMRTKSLDCCSQRARGTHSPSHNLKGEHAAIAISMAVIVRLSSSFIFSTVQATHTRANFVGKKEKGGFSFIPCVSRAWCDLHRMIFVYKLSMREMIPQNMLFGTQ